ncbi:MAG TPA: YoaK family protein [Stellaceae bacterium]
MTESSPQRIWSGTASAAADLAGRTLPFVLSLTAGSTDIIGFLGLNGLFTAHITGNLVVLAAHIVAGDPTVFSYVLSVPVFMMVLFLTRLLAGRLEQAGVPTLQPLLLLQLLFLVAFLSICIEAGPWRDTNALLAVIAGMCGVAAMAVQNALVQISLTNAPTTAVMTTNVTRFMLDLGEALVGRDHAQAARARTRAMRTLPVIVGFTIGCVFGAAFEAAAGLWSLALPTGLAVLAFAIGCIDRRRPS